MSFNKNFLKTGLIAAPLIFFLILCVIFVSRLSDETNLTYIPSPLIEKAVPQFLLPNLYENKPDLDNTILEKEGLYIVNVWASWCIPCRQEHPILIEMGKIENLHLIGLNYKNQRSDAVKFLNELSDPFDHIGWDIKGRTAIDWGVYGVPETFLVEDGVILAKHIGPLDANLEGSTFYKALQEKTGFDIQKLLP